MIVITTINTSVNGIGFWYWTGTGLSTDFARAKRFATREDAFVEWNDYCNSFPGWEASLLETYK